MADLLCYIEDAGAANYLAPVLRKMLKAMSAGESRVVAAEQGAKVLATRGIRFDPLHASATAARLIGETRPRLVITGTSENRDTIGLKLIDEARRQSLVSIGVVDGPANADHRFSGPEGAPPLRHAPDWLVVADRGAERSYVERGFRADRIAVCGHPAYERAIGFADKHPSHTRWRRRAELFPDVDPDQSIVVFVAELSDGFDAAAYRRQPGYTLNGWGTSDKRTDVVFEELLDALNELCERTYLVLRLHPNNTEAEFACYWDQIDYISYGGDPLAYAHTADLVVGLTSILLDEAAILGRPSLSVVPRAVERDWLAGIGRGWVRSATDRASLRGALRDMLSLEYVPAEIDGREMRGASARATNFIRDRLEDAAVSRTAQS